MNFTVLNLLLSAGLFVGMLLATELGRRLGASGLARIPDKLKESAGPLEASIFALLGLLIAFSFSGAASRFEQRGQLIVQEANAVGTAWLRLDLLPQEFQPGLRQAFRDYLDARLATYAAIPDAAATAAQRRRAEGLQADIWNAALAALREPQTGHADNLVVPTLNQMFDAASSRLAALHNHPPRVIFGMLYALALGSSLLAGYDAANARARNWIHLLGFAAAIALTVFVIVDLEYPRLGFIRPDIYDQPLIDLRRAMG